MISKNDKAVLNCIFNPLAPFEDNENDESISTGKTQLIQTHFD